MVTLVRYLSHWVTSVSMVQCVAVVLIIILTGSASALHMCITDEDCPQHGVCFKDECSRCVCPKDWHVVKVYRDERLTETCQKRPVIHPRVGQSCDKSTTHDQCPHGSTCDNDTLLCTCKTGLVSHRDGSRCRHATYGERCNDVVRCEHVGLECRKRSMTCRCKSSYTRRPSAWTRFILHRWDYKKITGSAQQCTARAVGEPCKHQSHCAAITGSGATCGPCGFCQCQVEGHVPEILGNKCGPGLNLNAVCSIVSPEVCDGTQGLQCGDVCDIYTPYSIRYASCACSQMHDNINNKCFPKQVGSHCNTDLDCYLIVGGFGYCHEGRCQVDGSAAQGYMPYMVNRVCDKNISEGSHRNIRKKHKHDAATKYGETRHLASDVIDERSSSIMLGNVSSNSFPGRLVNASRETSSHVGNEANTICCLNILLSLYLIIIQLCDWR